MADFERTYEDAIASALLPGAALVAGNKEGDTVYSKAFGKRTLKQGVEDDAFTQDTIYAIASMTKLMTALAVLQCVEDGLLELDSPVSEHLPGIGKYGIITGWDEAENKGIFEQHSTKITLRMLLCHTSGHEYDWFNPLLGKWRASRNEGTFSGPTVEHKATLPLVFEPGARFAYGVGMDWVGRLIEKVTGQSLHNYMAAKIWDPLGISDITFFPKRHARKDTFADLSTLSETGEPPAVDLPGFDMTMGADESECLGGAGAYASTAAYFKVVQAVLRRDSRLFRKEESWIELFKPQLDAKLEQSFNDYVNSTPMHVQFIGMGVPPEIRKTWCLAGMLCLEGQEGRFSKSTVFWAGVPTVIWYIDSEAGLCGVAGCQILPPLTPPVMKLHEGFQRGVYKKEFLEKSS